MDGQQRQRLVLDRLRESGRVEVADLARELGTSEVTVRRDLEQLADVGALRRVRGGAVPSSLRGEGVPFDLRTADESDRKLRLGEAVASLIDDGEAVSVDSGTTGAAVARALAGRRVTAVPMSVQSLVAVTGRASIVVPGGEVDPEEGTFVGPLLEQTFTGLRLDTAVMSCCGVDPSAGVMAYSLRDAAAKRAAHRAAARTVLVAESDKFGRSAMALVCPLTEVSVLVTDDAVSDAVREFCAGQGIELVVVRA
ncbi:DeoR/GlpR family DNA-binding transcription regulator [Curtobacterium pusillum]|uniref:DeoR/GlpR family DNA-binding transcription regulator n=1 Tax=Curtobacterium pusillum TaxID=69373 RepID=UPI0011A38359|nr:DeoR/GlpR family DNA-binding transcription regulator [Curtobacterium pusillum]